MFFAILRAMRLLPLFVVCVVFSVPLFIVWRRLREARRADFIRSYAFPKGLIEKLQQLRPGLPAKDGQLVARALRHFFLAHLKSGRQFVAMPSQVTDDLWHEFILYTRHYDRFCKQAFGRFMHHTPAVVLATAQRDNTGLRRTWWQCCKEENINPRKPTRLPLLFALDAKLGIENGFRYAPDCSALRAGGDGSVYCGGDFSSHSFDGGTDGFGDASSSSSSSSDSSSSSSSDSSSDGGSSCGGGSGCGGGGD
jgi:hypothetical protein